MVNRYVFLAREAKVLRLIAAMYDAGPDYVHPVHALSRLAGFGGDRAYVAARRAALLGLVELVPCMDSLCARLTPEGRRVGEKLAELLRTAEELGLWEKWASLSNP